MFTNIAHNFLNDKYSNITNCQVVNSKKTVPIQFPIIGNQTCKMKPSYSKIYLKYDNKHI